MPDAAPPKFMFGFGSLLDYESLAATVPDAHTIQSAYIKGFIRNFSVWDATGWTETNLELAGEPYCAVNVQISDDPNARVNGIVFQMSDKHYARLLEREFGYELVKTQVYNFEDGTALGECLVFSSNKNDGTYNFESAAQRRYLEVCLKGASKFGERFYREFLKTTFIGDTPLDEISDLKEICTKYF